MPRTKAVEPTRKLNMSLDEALLARLDIHLYSDVQGRVPVGAYKAFFEQRLREFFARLDKVKEPM